MEKLAKKTIREYCYEDDGMTFVEDRDYYYLKDDNVIEIEKYLQKKQINAKFFNEEK